MLWMPLQCVWKLSCFPNTLTSDDQYRDTLWETSVSDRVCVQLYTTLLFNVRLSLDLLSLVGICFRAVGTLPMFSVVQHVEPEPAITRSLIGTFNKRNTRNVFKKAKIYGVTVGERSECKSFRCMFVCTCRHAC